MADTNKLSQIIDILNDAKKQVELKSQIDHSYVSGKIDGWNEAINYLVGVVQNTINEGMNNDIESK